MAEEELNGNEEEKEEKQPEKKSIEVPEGYEEYEFDGESDDEYETEEDEKSSDEQFENVEFNEEETGHCSYKLTAKFLKERVTSDLDKAYADINHSATIDGFRKGKVPKWLLEQRFGKEIQGDLKNQFKYIAVQYIEDKLERKVISEPDFVEPEEKLRRGFSYEISISYETEPEFELKPISEIKVQSKKIEIPEDKITEILENIKKQNPKLEKKDAPAEIGDIINVNYTLFCEGKDIADRNNETWKLEEGTFADVELLEGEEGAVGMSVGDEREIKIRMPKQFVIPQYAEKEGTVKVKVLEVQSELEREIDDELAKTVNFESLDKLKEQIQKDLGDAYSNAQKNGLTTTIVKEYVDGYDFSFPEKFRTQMIEDAKNHKKYDIMMKLYREDPKAEKDEVTKKVDEELKEAEEEITKDVDYQLRSDAIFRKIAETERIFVTEEEFEMTIYQMAYQYQTSPDQMMKTIEERNMQNQLRNDILTNKVREHFFSQATKEEIDEVYEPPKHDHDHDHDHDHNHDHNHDHDHEH